MELNLFHHISSLFDELNKKIEALAKSKNVQPEWPIESEETNEISSALSKAQGMIPPVKCNKFAAYNKNAYADLGQIIKVITPALEKNGLSTVFHVHTDNSGREWLILKVRHSSGQWFLSRRQIVPEGKGPQAYGSALTYYKRYMISAMLFISDEEDDDGEEAQKIVRDKDIKGVSINHQQNKTPSTKSSFPISPEQYEMLINIIEGDEDIVQKITSAYRINHLSEIEKENFNFTMKRVGQLKKLKNEK